MAVFGKPSTVTYTCYELGHTWTPSCTMASVSVALDVFREAVKIYGSLYLVAAVLKGKGKKYFTNKFLKETVRSTIFLTTNGTLFIMFFCVCRKITGFYFYHNSFACGIPACAMSLSIERKDRKMLGRFFFITSAFIPALAASYVALLLERTNRRGLLAVYMANVATETFYRMAVSRGWVSSIKHGEESKEHRPVGVRLPLVYVLTTFILHFIPSEVLLFSIATALFLYFFRKNSLPSSIVSAFRFLVGKDELPASALTENPASSKSPLKVPGISGKLPLPVKRIVNWVQNLEKHSQCQHSNSCAHYVLQGFVKMFCGGFVVQGGIKLLSSIPRLMKQPSALWQAVKHRDNFRLAAFLGCFSAIFRAVNCLLRWMRNCDEEIHGLLAGFLAGWSMMWYKSVTVALYTAFKMAEVLYFKGIDRGILPYIKCADIIIYSISTAFVFHVAVVEPHNLRPAYWTFLLRVTGNKFSMMNRKLMEPMVPFASKINPDFWPNYDSRYTDLVRPASLAKS